MLKFVCLFRLLGVVALSICLTAVLEPCRAADKPNIVVVLFDDLGYGQPPSYREKSEFKMPNLDRLVKEGLRFTDAHSAAAVCTPTRYGLLTGRYPSRIGQFGVLTTFSKPIIPKERVTVASLLKKEGYATACIGKWHLGMNWVDGNPGDEASVTLSARMTDGPNALGFDYFFGFTHARNIGTIIEQDKAAAHVKPVENQPRMIDKAVEWIDGRAKAGGPFFLYFPMCPPHLPIVPAPDVVGKSGVTGKEADYGDWMYQGDEMLGRILEALERNKLAGNTLVIATSDNGAEGRAYPPLRGSKRSIYEGGHRVPFVARWPGKVKPGSVSDATICLNDLLATAAEIVGAKFADNAAEDSVSFLPLLLGDDKGAKRESTIHQSSAGDLAIRQGPWKLVFLTSGQRELYNLQDDIGETKDVAAANPQIVERLANLMKQQIADGRSTPGALQKNDVPIVLDGKVKKKKSKDDE